MAPEVNLLQHIHQGAVMGIDSIRHLTTLSEDARFSAALNDQIGEYENIRNEAATLLRRQGEEAKGISAMSKMMSDMMSNFKSMADHSPSKLAEIMIQGSTMGTTNLTKQLNDYAGSDHATTALAKKLLKTEERNIEQMKNFL